MDTVDSHATTAEELLAFDSYWEKLSSMMWPWSADHRPWQAPVPKLARQQNLYLEETGGKKIVIESWDGRI